MLTGCDSGVDSAGPDEEDFTLALVGNASSFTPGTVVELALSGASVPTSGEIALSARVGETDVLLAPVRQDTLAFFVPAVAAGRHTLTVDFEGLTAEVPFTVAAYQEIEDPTAYVAGEVENLSSSLGAMIEAETDPAVRSHFQAQQEELDGALEEWAELPAEQQAMVAYTVREMLLEIGVARATLGITALGTECVSFDELSRQWRKLGRAGYSLVLSGGAIFSGFPPIQLAGAVVGGIAAAVFIETAQELIPIVAESVLECVYAQAINLVEGSTAAQARGATGMAAMSFTHGVSKTMAIETGSAVQEAVLEIMQEADALMHEYANYVPDAWLTAFDAPEDLLWQPGAPDDLTLSSISESGIEGTLEVSGDEVALAFSYSDAENQPEEAQDFTYTLGFGEETAEFEASLEPVTDGFLWPLAIGNSWTWRLLDDEEEDTEYWEITQSQTTNGTELFTLRDTYGPFAEFSYLYRSDDGLCEIYDEGDFTGEEGCTPGEGTLLYRYPVEDGLEYWHDTLDYLHIVVDIRSLSLPNADFEQAYCYKQYDVFDGQEESSEICFVPGIGPVAWYDYFQGRELEGYVIDYQLNR